MGQRVYRCAVRREIEILSAAGLSSLSSVWLTQGQKYKTWVLWGTLVCKANRRRDWFFFFQPLYVIIQNKSMGGGTNPTADYFMQGYLRQGFLISSHSDDLWK